MKLFSVKQVCIITMILHLILLSAAWILIAQYQDAFLIVALILLLLYLFAVLLMFRGKCIAIEVLAVYFIGVMIQAALTQGFGFFGDPNYGFLGTLDFGSGIAMVLYGFALLISCGILLLIVLVKWILKK